MPINIKGKFVNKGTFVYKCNKCGEITELLRKEYKERIKCNKCGEAIVEIKNEN